MNPDEPSRNGRMAEKFVIEQFENLGFEVEYVDDYYDIKVTKDGRSMLIEIKSSKFMMDHSGPGTGRRFARWDFTDGGNRRKQRTNNVHYCFVVRIGSCCQIFGLLRARAFSHKRYISLTELMSRKTRHFESWILQHFPGTNLDPEEALTDLEESDLN